jgi:hypothetical protein
VEEDAILRHAFDLVFAFDEVISLGHKENITLTQARRCARLPPSCVLSFACQRIMVHLHSSHNSRFEDCYKVKQCSVFFLLRMLTPQRSVSPADQPIVLGWQSLGEEAAHRTSVLNDSTRDCSIIATPLRSAGEAKLRDGEPRGEVAQDDYPVEDQ